MQKLFLSYINFRIVNYFDSEMQNYKRRDTKSFNSGGKSSSNVKTYSRASKTVPHANLVMLKLDGTNISTRSDAMSMHLQTNYGLLGNLL